VVITRTAPIVLTAPPPIIVSTPPTAAPTIIPIILVVAITAAPPVTAGAPPIPVGIIITRVVAASIGVLIGDLHVLRMDEPDVDEVAEHGLLQGNQGMARENQPFVLLHTIIWLFHEQLRFHRECDDVVCPSDHLKPSKVLAIGRSRPQALDPHV
jgi:hypothetical protein